MRIWSILSFGLLLGGTACLPEDPGQPGGTGGQAGAGGNAGGSTSTGGTATGGTATGGTATGGTATGGSSTCEATGSGTIPGGFTESEIVWRDEFNGSGLPDQTKWQIMVWAKGTVNNEVQAYVNSVNNLNQSACVLNITALNSNNVVTSGRVESKSSWAPASDNSVVYRVETRALMAGGGGTWPAYWLLGKGSWPACGEIDIFEYVGNSHYFQCAAHDSSAINHTMKSYSPSSPETQWHVYAINFYGDHMEFYVDNVAFHTFTRPASWSTTNWPFTNQNGNGFRVILNLAIGGTMGGTVDYNAFPMVQKFDYVRVYEKRN